MRSILPRTALAAALGLAGLAAPCAGQEPTRAELQARILDLEEANQVLQRGLAEANLAEREANEQLARVRERLEALGRNLLDGGEDRLVQAAADFQVQQERLDELENASFRLAASVSDYLRQAVVADPDARLRVETSLRELDVVLGLRQKPRPDVRTGSLQQARVVSVAQDSGLLVLNLGENQEASIGMRFRLFRNQLPLGNLILVDVRKDVSGAFVEEFDASAESPRVGDLAVLETQ